MKKILYRILTLFTILFGGPFFFIYSVATLILHYMTICPIAYLMTGKWLTTDYLEKVLDSYLRLYTYLQEKGT